MSMRPALLAAIAAGALCAGADTPATWTLLVSGYAPAISTLAFDPVAGTATPRASSTCGANPSYLDCSPDGRFAYACAGGDRIIAMAVKPDWTFTRINDVSAGGKGTCHVAVHPGGRWVFNACYTSGQMGLSAVKDDGSLAEPAQVVTPGIKAHQVVFDAGGRFVFVPCLGSDWIAQYRFDPATGTLTPNEPAIVPTAKGAGPRHLAWHPSRRFAYLINELDATLTALSYDADKGVLTPVQTLRTLPADFRARNSAAAVVVAPSGDFVYASNRGHDSIAIIRLDDGGARMTLVGNERAGGEINVPRCFCLDPTGTWMAVANQKGASVTLLKVDRATGLLNRTGQVQVPPQPSYVRLVPSP